MKKLLYFLLALAAISCKKNSIDQDKADRETIHKYLADHGLTADSTSTGLYYIISDPGSGNNPNAQSYVTVNYKGYFTNGNIFDQTTGSPRRFTLNSVIPAWTIGIPLIKKGGKIMLLVPSSLGYGSTGHGEISGNTVILFDIELVDFQ